MMEIQNNRFENGEINLNEPTIDLLSKKRCHFKIEFSGDFYTFTFKWPTFR